MSETLDGQASPSVLCGLAVTHTFQSVLENNTCYSNQKSGIISLLARSHPTLLLHVSVSDPGFTPATESRGS